MTMVIIVAAGRGSRMGRKTPKQFLELAGEPVLVHTLRGVAACPDIDGILIALPPEEMSSFSSLFERAVPSVRIVAGGGERQESVFNALQAIDRLHTDIIVVHDGVRPLVTGADFSRVIARARETGAAILACPVRDTVKEVEGDRIVRTLDRQRLYLAQTPQAFRADILIEAHERARREGIMATDDAALVERCGHPVVVVEGSPYNIKITWPEDLLLAEALLRLRGGL